MPPPPPAYVLRPGSGFFPKTLNVIFHFPESRKPSSWAELVDLAVWADTHSISMWRCRMAWWNTYDMDLEDEEPEVLIDLSE